MSSLTVDQMLQEAIGPINARLKYINEQKNMDTISAYQIVYDPSFDFIASDGKPLGVKFFNSRVKDPGGVADIDIVAGRQSFYTVITKAGYLTNYPCFQTSRGDVIFVYDPTVTGADKIFDGQKRLVDEEELEQPSKEREVSNRVGEHVPRPMNAFIIYRNAQTAAVRKQNPGIGNNDVSRIIGKKWRALDPATRAHYKSLAARSARDHRAKHPGYKYTPRKPDDVVRRRKRCDATEQLQPIRDPAIHRSADSTITPILPLHRLIPGFPDLDSLTKTWIEEPTAAHFDALMSGFDCALGLAAEDNP